MLSLCFLILSYLPSHDIQVAIFRFEKVEKKLMLDIAFERNDFLAAQEKDETILSEEIYQSYLNENLAVEINKKGTHIQLDSIQIEGPHYKLFCSIPFKKRKVSRLKIRNTCLLKVEGHSNIIELRLNEDERDFLMNKDRTVIDVQYK